MTKTCHQDLLDAIATIDSDVTTNTANIATNTTDIATNAAAISGLGSILGKNTCLVTYKSKTEVYVNPGQVDVDGTMVSISSQQTLTPSVGASTMYYVYVNSSGTLSTSTTAPTLDLTKRGWYNSALRCIGYYLSNSSSEIIGFTNDGRMYTYHASVVDNAWTSISTGGTTVTHSVPLGNITGIFHILTDGTQDLNAYKTDRSNANDNFDECVTNVGGPKNQNLVQLPTSASKQITYYTSAGSTNTTVRCYGFINPAYMYGIL